jgi:hypothetical protein
LKAPDVERHLRSFGRTKVVPSGCDQYTVTHNEFTAAYMISLSDFYTNLLSSQIILPIIICTIFFLVTINRFFPMPKRRAIHCGIPTRNVKRRGLEDEVDAELEPE